MSTVIAGVIPDNSPATLAKSAKVSRLLLIPASEKKLDNFFLVCD